MLTRHLFNTENQSESGNSTNHLDAIVIDGFSQKFLKSKIWEKDLTRGEYWAQAHIQIIHMKTLTLSMPVDLQ